MPNFAPLKTILLPHALLLLVIALAFLLSACSSTSVVTEAVSLRPVPRDLMRPAGSPRCALAKAADYAPGEVVAYAKCWTAAYNSLAARHSGLQRAVANRESATRKAVKASKL